MSDRLGAIGGDRRVAVRARRGHHHRRRDPPVTPPPPTHPNSRRFVYVFVQESSRVSGGGLPPEVSHSVTTLGGMRLDAVIDQLAAEQHSLIAVWQLSALGLDGSEVARLRHGGRWRPVTRRVLGLVGGVDTMDRSDMAAVLDASPGAVISHDAAARRWGAPAFELSPLHVTRHRGMSRRSSSLATVHEVIDLLPSHVKLMRGVPLDQSRPHRVRPRRVGPPRPGGAAARLDVERAPPRRSNARPHRHRAGRPRAHRQRARCASWPRLEGPTTSLPPAGWRRASPRSCRRAGMASLRRQVDAGDDEWAGRVDFRDRDLPLVVEIHSEKHHTSLVDRAADAARIARLEAAGFTGPGRLGHAGLARPGHGRWLAWPPPDEPSAPPRPSTG